MQKIIAIQIDPVEGLNYRTDTSAALGAEAERRGYRVFCYQPHALTLKNGAVFATGNFVSFAPDNNPPYKVLENAVLNLFDIAAVLMRQDPPFNMDYITATYFLEMVAEKTRVINNPTAVRNNPEKLLPLAFPKFAPPTVITRSYSEVEAFFKEHKDIVIKPLYLYGGKGVFRFKESLNLKALHEFFQISLSEPMVVQKYLPEVETADKRVIIINGKVIAAMQRIPEAGEIRANTRVGGSIAKTELTASEQEVSETVAAYLKEKDIFIAGLDLIGGWLTEVNITSPTGIRLLNGLYDMNIEKIFWDEFEK